MIESFSFDSLLTQKVKEEMAELRAEWQKGQEARRQEDREFIVSAIKQALTDSAAENATMTTEQVCRYYDVTRTTLWRWGKEGKLNPRKVAGGRRVAYLRRDVESLIDNVRAREEAKDKKNKLVNS